MACSPPIKPKSRPYWKGHMDTRVQAARHFQWALMPYFSSTSAVMATGVSMGCSTSFSAMVEAVSLEDMVGVFSDLDSDRWISTRSRGNWELRSSQAGVATLEGKVERFQRQLHGDLKGFDGLERRRNEDHVQTYDYLW